MRRANPNSRPRGLARTSPPAAVTATCRPQQLPKKRHAGGKDGLGKVDLARHGSAAVVDVECRSGHGDAVVALETDSRRESGAVPGGHDVDAERRVDAVQNPRVSGSR